MRVISPQSGFSLIELMMAIFIMALATSFVVLTLPPQSSQLEEEAERLAGTLQRGADQAMISGHLVGLDITDTGYGLVRWRGGAWQAIPGQHYILPASMDISYHSETDRDVPTNWPEARFDPIGRVEAAEIILMRGTERVALSLSRTMEISVDNDAR